MNVHGCAWLQSLLAYLTYSARSSTSISDHLTLERVAARGADIWILTLPTSQIGCTPGLINASWSGCVQYDSAVVDDISG
jgi:hypothetical protein